MRTPEGIQKKVKDIKKFIAYEEECIRTGERLGTFHHPQQRIKEYKKRIKLLTP